MESTAAIPRTHGAEKPQIYDLAEGMGSIYGRYVRNHLCRRLVKQYGIRSVLEAPCNAEAYFASPGTQSVVFTEEGCQVTLLHPDVEVVAKTRAFWAALELGATPVHHHPNPDHAPLPFENGQFDLVWNFDSIPLLADPAYFIAEMARVSRHLVMIILPNRLNIGYPLHCVLNTVRGTRSLWGSPTWMSEARTARVMHSLGLKIVESGLVDMPPWPGFDGLSVIGRFVRRNTVQTHGNHRSDAELERMLGKLTFIEYAPVPQWLKTPFAHQRYIIASTARD